MSDQPKVEKAQSTSLDPALLDQWRREASRIGGVPSDHPEVPAEYVYTANRLVALIDDLGLNYPPAPEGGGDRG